MQSRLISGARFKEIRKKKVSSAAPNLEDNRIGEKRSTAPPTILFDTIRLMSKYI